MNTKLYEKGRLVSPRCDKCDSYAIVTRRFEKGSPDKDGKCEWSRCSRHILESHDPPQIHSEEFYATAW